MMPDSNDPPSISAKVLGLSAITLATHDMPRAVRFYRSLGFVLHFGGEAADFTSFAFGSSFLNLILQPLYPLHAHLVFQFDFGTAFARFLQ